MGIISSSLGFGDLGPRGPMESFTETPVVSAAKEEKWILIFDNQYIGPFESRNDAVNDLAQILRVGTHTVHSVQICRMTTTDEIMMGL